MDEANNDSNRLTIRDYTLCVYIYTSVRFGSAWLMATLAAATSLWSIPDDPFYPAAGATSEGGLTHDNLTYRWAKSGSTLERSSPL